MTRDTKVGIVVSCSFLCLVGVVLVNKLREPDVTTEPASPPGQVQKEQSPESEKKSDDKKPVEGKAPSEAPVAVAASAPVKAPPVQEPPDQEPKKPPQDNSDLLKPPPPPGKPAAPIEPAHTEAPADESPEKKEKEPKKNSEVEAPVAAANADEKKGVASLPTAPVSAPTVEAPTIEVPNPSAEVKPAETPEVTEKAVEEKKGEEPPSRTVPKPSPVPPAPPTAEPVISTQEEPVKSVPDGQEKKEIEKPEPPVSSVPVIEVPSMAKEPATGTTEGAEGTEKSGRLLPRPEEAGVTQPPSEAKPIDGGPPPVKEGKLIPVPSAEGVKAEPPAATPDVPNPSAPITSTPAVTETPRQPERIAPIASTHVPRPAVGGVPEVDAFDVEEYTVQPGDTYATISRKKYLSEKFAEALAKFQKHSSMLDDPGKNLTAGQVIELPELRILEKRYPQVIPGARSVDAPIPDAADKKIVPVSAVVPPTAEPGRAAIPYRVPPQGQTMREIARLTLGDGERWGEVFRLNRQHRPDFAVPGGTVLQLPVDARVEPATQPR